MSGRAARASKRRKQMLRVVQLMRKATDRGQQRMLDLDRYLFIGTLVVGGMVQFRPHAWTVTDLGTERRLP